MAISVLLKYIRFQFSQKLITTLKPLSQLAHDQKRPNIRATEKIRHESPIVAEIIAYEKSIRTNIARSQRALCDVNASNLAIYLASICDCCTMKATVER